jgi:predicted dehydrogenase
VSNKVRVGVVGTSWWADAMYLPALTGHPLADVRCAVGSRMDHTQEFARRWLIPDPPNHGADSRSRTSEQVPF